MAGAARVAERGWLRNLRTSSDQDVKAASCVGSDLYDFSAEVDNQQLEWLRISGLTLAR